MLEPCQYCKSTNLSFEEKYEKKIGVVCEECGSRGPFSPTKENASNQWNVQNDSKRFYYPFFLLEGGWVCDEKTWHHKKFPEKVCLSDAVNIENKIRYDDVIKRE